VEAFTLAGDRAGLAMAREQSGNAALQMGDLSRASQTLAEVQPEMFGVVARSGVEVVLARSDIARRSGDSLHARLLLDSAAVLTRSLDVSGLSGDLAYRRAMLALAGGRFTEARTLLAANLASQPATSPLLRYQLLARLAEVDAREGKLGDAERRLESALGELDRWRTELIDRDFQLAATQSRGFDWDPDLDVATVIAAIATKGNAETALRLADSRRARVLLDQSARRAVLVRESTTRRAATGSDTSSTTMRSTVPANTAIIAYTTGQGAEPTTIIVIAAGKTSAVVTMSGDSIADIARRFVAFLGAGHLARPASRRLASVLIDPVRHLLPAEVKRLVIVPDGSIHRVPFAALMLAGDTLVAQRFEIVVAPSVGIALRGLPSGVRSRAGVLVFGAPDVAPASASRIAAGPIADQWPPLPGAHREMHDVARRISRSEIIEGAAATLSALQVAAKRGGPVLHLATHARAMEGSLMSGAMLFSSARGASAEATAPEIAAMSLPFDLVVLSACESANGQLLTGEGLQGLANAFLEAGARGVLATRWRLEDVGAEHFLRAFYRSLAEGKDATSALAVARQDAIGHGVSPATWANFELIGDPMVAPRLEAARLGATRASLLAILLAVLLIGYGVRFAVSRKTL
jgi:CHAT domain-containing protein